MKLFDWIKDKIDGDDKPAPKSSPQITSPSAPPQAQAQFKAQARPAAGQPAPYSADFQRRIVENKQRAEGALTARQNLAKVDALREAGLDWTGGMKVDEYNAFMAENQAAAQFDPSKGYGSVGVWAPMDAPSDGVLELLNEEGFKVPDIKKPVGMPDTSFESINELKSHEYTITADELGFIRDTYSSARADSWGYRPPPAVKVDDNMPLMNSGPAESAALTWEAYNELSDPQKAAVGFNTLLVDAREKDLAKSWSMTPEQRAEYDAAVYGMFGDNGGSATLAPNTVALLKDLDLTAVGQDLDEYLSLERAIDVNELGSFKLSSGDVAKIGEKLEGRGEPSYAEVRAPENLAKLDSQVVRKSEDLIKGMVSDPNAMLLNFDTLMNGPTAEMQLTGSIPTGYGGTASDEMFRTAFSVLGSTNPEQFGIPAGTDVLSFLLEDLALQGADEDAQKEFLQFVANRTQMLGLYGTDDDKRQAALASKRAGLGD